MLCFKAFYLSYDRYRSPYGFAPTRGETVETFSLTTITLLIYDIQNISNLELIIMCVLNWDLNLLRILHCLSCSIFNSVSVFTSFTSFDWLLTCFNCHRLILIKLCSNTHSTSKFITGLDLLMLSNVSEWLT